MVHRPLRPGVYAPLPTFFDDNQEIDYVSYKKHLLSTEPRIFVIGQYMLLISTIDLATRGMGR